MSATFVRWQPGTAPEALSAALFGGALVVFAGLPPVQRLVRYVRALLQEIFETDDPPTAESRLAAGEYRRLAVRARNRVATDQALARHWRDVLAVVGYHPESTWLDRIRLRVVPSRTDIDHRRLKALPAHRDTWGSGIMAQINWWLPLYALQKTRTMLLWPQAFRDPVANNSAEWDFEEVKHAERGYPLLPVARAYPKWPATPVLIDPGDVLAFSAAHLHAGVRDASGRTRFGIDSRTVWESDRLACRGAPNVDGAARAEMWQWYVGPVAGGHA